MGVGIVAVPAYHIQLNNVRACVPSIEMYLDGNVDVDAQDAISAPYMERVVAPVVR